MFQHLPIIQNIYSALRSLVSIIVPHTCYVCKIEIQSFGLCHDCWNKLSFMDSQRCNLCSKKLPEYHIGQTCLVCQGIMAKN